MFHKGGHSLLSIKATAVIKKESAINPKTRVKEFYSSLTVFDENGKEHAPARYFPHFEAVAALLTREAGVTHEQLQDRHARYEKGEDVRISLTLEDDAAMGWLGINPNEGGDPNEPRK
jgi:hypothetical protein